MRGSDTAAPRWRRRAVSDSIAIQECAALTNPLDCQAALASDIAGFVPKANAFVSKRSNLTSLK
jgi:hypothetical protein